MVSIKFIKDFATRKAGDVIEIDGMIASSIISRGFAIREDSKADKPDTELSLKELRVKYPHIKSNSVEKFLEKLNA